MNNEMTTDKPMSNEEVIEVLKAYCKNRECNKDCIFFREVHIGNNKDTFCALCEIVTSDDKENNND